MNEFKLKAPVSITPKDILEQQLQRRFGMIEHVSIIALSTLLDPRFKNLYFKNAEASGKAASFLRRAISEKMQSSSSESESDGVPPDEFDFWLHHMVLD